MLFHNKRGVLEKPLWFLIDLVITVIILYYSATYVDQITSTTSFEKNFLSKDLALLMDSLYAAPEVVVLKYPQKTLWFSYEFDHNKVKVFEKKPLASAKESYFMEDKTLEFQPVTLSPKKEMEDEESFIKKYFSYANIFTIKTPELESGTYVNIFFNKDLNSLSIINEKKEHKIKFRCPGILTKEDPKQKVFLIDQQHVNNEKVDILSASVGYSLYSDVKDNFKEILHTRIGEIWDIEANTKKIDDSTLNKRLDDSDIIVSIRIGNNQNKVNVVKAYYSSESNEEIQKKSEKLACLILNKLLDENELNVVGANIIPTEDYDNLKKNKVAVLLEIGNIQIKREENILMDTKIINKIGRLISDGIIEYYSS